MAKKAKSVKKAKKTAKKTAASAGKAAKHIMVPLHSVVHFVHMIEERGHTDEFVKAAKDSKIFMAMRPASVKFVRQFLTDNRLHRAMTARVVDPCPNDPFECKFRD